MIEYIKQADESHQAHLQAMYELIKQVFPEAEEKMAYGMPTFHEKVNAVYFGDNKKHLGFYPTPSVIEAFAERLDGYKFSKGAVQFPYNKELPKELIYDMLQYRKSELAQK
ncbi:hypothetical protein HB912_07565 [Listeria aquatica]|uniref:YdhG-like domain-containing protein n=1 Tax=Listeria aquatica TaxID=1494960 RepID=A0A841ZPX4_9LIST|nr:DUF1801 domain-containing protein [Listeria aquatica]MBC1521502.1 hypothetical protein [Listeria aquatica]